MKNVKKFLSVILSVLIVFSVVSVTSLAADNSGRMKGDIDGSGEIRVADARLLLRLSAGLVTLESLDIDFSFADINGDGAITAEDARRVLRYTAQLNMDFSDSDEIADMTPSLSIACLSTNISLGATITFTVSADNMVGTKSNNLALMYDPDCLEFVDIQTCPLFNAVAAGGLFEDGVVHYASAFSNKATESGALFNVSFKVLEVGNLSLSCTAETWVGTHSPKDVSIVSFAHAHTYKMKILSDASCCSEGVVNYTCTKCGYDYMEFVPKIEHADNDYNGFCDVCSINLGKRYGDFSYIVKDGSVTITAMNYDIQGYIDIPDTIEGYPVTSIAEKAIASHYGFVGITIPAGVTAIGDGALAGCGFIKVNASNPNYASDGQGALFNKDMTVLLQYPCGDIDLESWNPDEEIPVSSEYTIPSGVKYIEKCAFKGCSRLKSLTVPRSVTAIGENAFDGDYELSYVYYEGSQEEWNRIEISEGNGCLNLARFMFRADFPEPPYAHIAINSDTMIITAGKGTIVKDIKNALRLNVSVSDKNGNPVAEDNKVGTGAKAVLADSDGNIMLSYDIVVPMDIDGNGEVTAADARLALRYSAKLETLDGVFKAAADINGDANITAANARTILRVSAKLDAYKF